MTTNNTTVNTTENNGVFEADIESIGKTTFDSHIMVENKPAADAITRIANIYGIKTSIGAEMVGDEPKIKVTLHDVDDDTLNQIERKLQISNWSQNVVNIMSRARDGVTNMGDFALNGALIPAASSVVQATGRTAQIVGVAAGHLGSVVTSTVIEEGKMTARRLTSDPAVWKAASDVKGLASDVKSGLGMLFGALSKNSNSKFTRRK